MNIELLDKRIIQLLDENLDVCYQLVDDVLVAYNRINRYQKINLYYFEMVIDEFVFNTNIKNTKLKNHYEINELLYNRRKYYYLRLKLIEIINTQEAFEEKLNEIKITNNKPTLLLHSCCGPCSSYVLDYLKDYFYITILYYNPNIDTIDEFNLRLENLKKINEKLGANVEVICPEYNHQRYLDYIKGCEDAVEGGRRCYLCYEERIEFLAQIAKGKYDYFTSTLSISPYKNSDWLNEIGIRMQDKYQVNYLYANFKLHDGYKKSIELSKKYNLYRQDYCGCEFSKGEK